MTALEVSFPDSWTIVPGGPRGRDAVVHLVSGLGAAPGGRPTGGGYLTGLLPLLDDLPVDSFACLFSPDGPAGTSIQALCAIGVVPGRPSAGGARLRAVAERGPDPDLDRETTTLQLPLGTAVRSSAFRFAEELLGSAETPYVAEVRYALPLAGARIGVLHFETVELARLADLVADFDGIAATARLA